MIQDKKTGNWTMTTEERDELIALALNITIPEIKATPNGDGIRAKPLEWIESTVFWANEMLKRLGYQD